MTFREIQSQDIPAIFEVRVKTWHNTNGSEEMVRMGITHEAVLKMMEQAHRGWLAEMDGEVVGFAMGDKTTGEMWVIAVLKDHENQGLGRTLMKLVEDWLFEQGSEKLWLVTDPDEEFRAVGFYKRLGWDDWKIEDGSRYMVKLRK